MIKTLARSEWSSARPQTGLMYKVVTGHVAVGPDQIGLVAADNRTRANHRFKFRAIGASSSGLRNSFANQNGWWLETAPCCCCWAGEPSCLQKSAWQASACRMPYRRFAAGVRPEIYILGPVVTWLVLALAVLTAAPRPLAVRKSYLERWHVYMGVVLCDCRWLRYPADVDGSRDFSLPGL